VAQDGELTPAFAELGPTLVLTGGAGQSRLERVTRRAGWASENLIPLPEHWSGLERLLRHGARDAVVRSVKRKLDALGPFDLAYLNSAHSAPALQLLAPDVPVLTHVHELSHQLDQLSSRELDEVLTRSDRYIAASGAARATLIENLGVDAAKIDVSYEFIPIDDAPPERAALDAARAELGIAPDAQVVGAVGAVGWIKGSDLLVPIAQRALKTVENAVFVWVGGARFDWQVAEHRYDADATGLAGRVIFAGRRSDPRPLMALFDVFVLPSRLDTYPLVALEAASLGKPVVCFDAGGMTEFLEPAERLVVPYLDIDAFAGRVVELLQNGTERATIGRQLADRVRTRHRLEVGAPLLLELIERFYSLRA
jgi:glycosyltransferase involved in cell wall biosynthesis